MNGHMATLSRQMALPSNARLHRSGRLCRSEGGTRPGHSGAASSHRSRNDGEGEVRDLYAHSSVPRPSADVR